MRAADSVAAGGGGKQSQLPDIVEKTRARSKLMQCSRNNGRGGDNKGGFNAEQYGAAAPARAAARPGTRG